MSKPTAGNIWRYPYLWAWQARRGETEGRKGRPVTLAAIIPVNDKETRLYLLAITGTVPTIDQDALEVPATEIRRAGLSEFKKLWVIVDEHNRDTLETSFYFEPNAQVGAFSKTFTKQIAARFLVACRSKAAMQGVDRSS